MAGVIDTSEFRKGMKIEIDGEPFEILDFQHVKPGKGSAFTRTTIRSVISGRNLQPTFKSGDKVDRPDIEEREMQFLYAQGDEFHFMDQKSFEQTYLSAKVLGEARNFLKENINASILFFNGKAIGVTLPNSVELRVVKCDPGVGAIPFRARRSRPSWRRAMRSTFPLHQRRGRSRSTLAQVSTLHVLDRLNQLKERKPKRLWRRRKVERPSGGGRGDVDRRRGPATDRRDPRGQRDPRLDWARGDERLTIRRPTDHPARAAPVLRCQ